jgi:hypothetical protein
MGDERHLRMKRVYIYFFSCLILGGCAGPHYSQHQLIGAKPCAIHQPSDLQRCLSKVPDKPVDLVAAVTGCVTTPFKNIGIFGWTDYGYKAEAIGKVIQARLSSDRLFTVDLMLNQIRIGDALLSGTRCRFLRAEVYQGNTPVPKNIREMSAPVVLIRGELVWDGDGHLEIHPEHAGDYQVISSLTNN